MNEATPMSWPTIIGITVATAILTGLIVGALDYPQGTAAVGASTGVVGGILIGRRRKARGA